MPSSLGALWLSAPGTQGAKGADARVPGPEGHRRVFLLFAGVRGGVWVFYIARKASIVKVATSRVEKVSMTFF